MTTLFCIDIHLYCLLPTGIWFPKKIAQPAGHAISVVYSLSLESLHFHEVLAVLVELLAIQYFLYYLFHCVILSILWVSHSSPPVFGGNIRLPFLEVDTVFGVLIHQFGRFDPAVFNGREDLLHHFFHYSLNNLFTLN